MNGSKAPGMKHGFAAVAMALVVLMTDRAAAARPRTSNATSANCFDPQVRADTDCTGIQVNCASKCSRPIVEQYVDTHNGLSNECVSYRCQPDPSNAQACVRSAHRFNIEFSPSNGLQVLTADCNAYSPPKDASGEPELRLQRAQGVRYVMKTKKSVPNKHRRKAK